jgi:Tfp pilus assembly protein PilN
MPKRDQGQRAFSGTLVVDGPVSIRLHVEEGRIREIRRSRTGFEENRPDRAPVDSEVGCIRSSYASADSSRSTTSAPTNLPRPSAAGSLHVSGTDRQFTCDAAVSAARFAAEANAELLLDDIRDHRDRQRRRMFSHRIVAAAMLLVATAGAEWLGATRELAVARERRDAIAGEVAPLIELRADVAMAGERIARIRELSRGSHWTPLLLDLALLLPDDAWLLGLRTSGDTVALDAVAANAGRSLEALRRSQAIMDLHIDGNIRRDVEDGQVTIERFRLLGRLPAAQPAIQQ